MAPVTFTLDIAGKTYTLRFGFKGIAAFQQVCRNDGITAALSDLRSEIDNVKPASGQPDVIDRKWLLEQLNAIPTRRDVQAQLPDLMRHVNAGSAFHMAALLWGLLREHHPEITLDGTYALIEAAGGLDGLNAALDAAKHGLTPDAADLKELGPNPRKAQTRVKRARGTGDVSNSTPMTLA